jgi:hypothetical protein
MDPQAPVEEGAPVPEPRRMRLRYPGICILCTTSIAMGAEAIYDPSSKTVRCLVCPVVGITATELPIDHGIAGGSAGREHARRAAKREARVKGKLGDRLGGVILALTDEPQPTRAWAQGARGEEELAESLARVPGVRVLHDRRVPGTPANIDHLVVAPAGVFVVDAKAHQGMVRIRDRGGFFRTDLRLYVGHQDWSELADGMGWQVAAVERELRSAALEVMPPISPVLCFVKAEWPLFRPPDSYRGVRLESKRTLRELVTRGQVLDAAAVERLTRILATAFPAK